MNYSSTSIPKLPWNQLVYQLMQDVSTPNFHPDSCLTNGYIKQDDKVGFHRDKQLNDTLSVVCTVSFGGTRYFKFKPYEKEWQKLGLKLPSPFEIKLEEGDVLYMFGKTNIYFEHEILCLRIKDNCEYIPRYSATFRQIRGTEYHKI